MPKREQQVQAASEDQQTPRSVTVRPAKGSSRKPASSEAAPEKARRLTPPRRRNEKPVTARPAGCRPKDQAEALKAPPIGPESESPPDGRPDEPETYGLAAFPVQKSSIARHIAPAKPPETPVTPVMPFSDGLREFLEPPLPLRSDSPDPDLSAELEANLMSSDGSPDELSPASPDQMLTNPLPVTSRKDKISAGRETTPSPACPEPALGAGPPATAAPAGLTAPAGEENNRNNRPAYELSARDLRETFSPGAALDREAAFSPEADSDPKPWRDPKTGRIPEAGNNPDSGQNLSQAVRCPADPDQRTAGLRPPAGRPEPADLSGGLSGLRPVPDKSLTVPAASLEPGSLVELKTPSVRQSVKLKKARALAAVFLILAAAAAVLFFRSGPGNNVFELNAGQRLTGTVPEKEPFNDAQTAINWASRKLGEIFALDFLHWDRQLKKLEASFTPDGFQGYRKFLKDEGVIKMLSSRRLNLTCRLIGAPVLTDRNRDKNHPVWQLELPVTVTYHSSDGPVKSQNLEVLLEVAKEDPVSKPQTLVIRKSLFKPVSRAFGEARSGAAPDRRSEPLSGF